MERMESILEAGWLFTDRPVTDGEREDCDTGGWEAVTLPHDWAVSRPLNREMPEGGPQGFLDRWGIGWYRRTLLMGKKRPGRRYLLTFEGVYENSTVWVNGRQAGGQLYGYTGFTLDVTELLRQGKNLVAVRVDNTAGPVDRWYSGAGIYRGVVFTEVNETHLDEQSLVVKTTLADNYGRATLEIDTGLPGAEVTAVLLADGAPVSDTASGTGSVSLTVPKVKAWSAASPHLYSLRVALWENGGEVDALTVRIGLREVAFLPGKGIFVNGRPEKLKGVCLHQDVAGVGNAVTKSLLRQRLQIFRDMGCNAIRTSHNTPSRDLLDLCDEMGFYVIDESFDKWDTGSYGRYFEAEWEKDLAYMVRRDRNRACVVMWSVGNEVDRQGSAAMLEKLGRLVGAVKALDTRPVTCALSPHYSDPDGNTVVGIDNTLPLISEIARRVDIMAFNYQEQWYEDFHAANPDKLIVGTETYLFFRGSRNNYFNFNTENPWMDVERSDHVLGGFLWAGVDYLGESMGYPCKGWCGAMVKSNHVRKPISWLFESYWSERPMVHITLQDYTLRDAMEREHWSTPRLSDCWNFPMYGRTPLPFMIFTNCEEVRVLLGGKEYDVKRPGECESRIISGYLPYQAGTLTVEGLIGGKKVCEHRLITAGEAARLVFETGKQHYKAEETRQILLAVGAVDEDGVPCIRESAEVRFAVQGDCILEGVDNGDMLGSEPYAADRVHLYQGTAAVILRTAGEKGRIVVSAFADGMLAGTTELIME